MATPKTPATPMTPLGNLNGTEAIEKALDDLSKPPSGVVLPPRDIRGIIEKTAGYVARNGQVFEQRIREKEKHNPKFSFLNPADSYASFYSWRLDEIRAGRSNIIADGRAGHGATTALEPEKPKGPKQPPEFTFSARMPTISAQDMDVLRLTAMFVAKHGRNFMTHLSQREARNFQFEFLRPNHSLYPYFSRLVDQYTTLMKPKGGISMAELERNVKEKFHILDKARARADWTKFQEKERVKKEEEEDAERLAYAQVDWHDFTVVETVVFTNADDGADLPPPFNLNDLQHASLEQKAMMSLHPNALRIEEAMPTDDIPIYAPAPYQPEPVAPPVAPHHAPAIPTQPSSMKIRNEQVTLPRAMARRQQGQMAICPNCQQQIPMNELDQHMKIEMLDPRWKEQKARADAKFATTNLNFSDPIENLKRLASQRADVFDTETGETVSEEEIERRKRQRASGGWVPGRSQF